LAHRRDLGKHAFFKIMAHRGAPTAHRLWRTVNHELTFHSLQPGDYKSRCAAPVRHRCATFSGKSDISQVATVRHFCATVRLTHLE